MDLTLILIHTRWSDDDDGTRDGEITEQILGLRRFLAERDLILAGDFNHPAGHAGPSRRSSTRMDERASDLCPEILGERRFGPVKCRALLRSKHKEHEKREVRRLQKKGEPG